MLADTQPALEVMVVDDSRTMRVILGRILRELGLTVIEAANGKEALWLLETRPSAVTLVLTDWNMPEMDGLELLKQMRKNPTFSSVIVMMVTTETENVNMEAALAAGANGYVMKPFTREILKEKLEMAGIPLPAAQTR